MSRLLVLLLLLPIAVPSAVAKDASELKAQVDALAEPFVEAGIVTGMVVGLVMDGERHVFAYGRLRPGEDAAPDRRTVFEIGSITKAFTGLLLADLVRDGTVTLDQPVAELLPEDVSVPSSGERKITLLDLATHTSGLPRMPSNFAPKDSRNPYADYDAQRLYAWLNDAELEHEPGARYEYSNVGAALLGHALSRVADKPYETLLSERILDPLSLSDTRITLTDSMRERLAPGHTADGTTTAPWDLNVFTPAGGLRSTVDDMLTFLEAILAGGDTPFGKSVEAALSLHAEPKGQSIRMGLGWHFGTAPDGRWHNGETGGYHAHAGILKDRGVGLVVLANTATAQVDRLAGLLYPVLVGKSVPPPELRVPAKIDLTVLDDYIGRYALAPSFVLTVTREDDRLMVQATGQAKFQVFPLGDDKFFYRVVEASIDFTRDEDDKVAGLILHQGGRDVPAARAD